VKITIAMVFTFVVSGLAFGGATRSYADAKAIWLRNHDNPQYQNYVAEFSQFNNQFHLDEKDGCYSLAPGPVNLMLVIVRHGNGDFALVERVLADVDNAKARCFVKSYSGISTKMPPFFPFVLQLTMGGEQ
jgi:hypothetical protein